MVLQKLENNAITKLCVKVTAFPFMEFGFFIRIARLFFSFGMDVSFFFFMKENAIFVMLTKYVLVVLVLKKFSYVKMLDHKTTVDGHHFPPKHI